jgi:hypothetical protein
MVGVAMAISRASESALIFKLPDSDLAPSSHVYFSIDSNLDFFSDSSVITTTNSRV